VVIPLENLPNVGRCLASELNACGIHLTEQLIAAGSLEVACRLQKKGFPVCQSKLAALEGAIRGIRWHEIAKQERLALWDKLQEMA